MQKIKIVLPTLIVAVVASLFRPVPLRAQTVTRLTGSEVPKNSITISGNGQLAVWIERVGNDDFYLKGALTGGGLDSSTTFITSTAAGIAGLQGQCWQFGDSGSPFYLRNFALRASYNGGKVVTVLSKEVNGKARYCFGVVDVGPSGFTLEVIPLFVPAAMGSGEGLDMYYVNAFDVNADGSQILYALRANSDPGDEINEDASAIIAVNTASRSGACLAGCFQRDAGDYGSVTSSGFPAHVRGPAVADGWAVFAGSGDAARGTGEPDGIYRVALDGGTPGLIHAYELSAPVSAWSHVFFFRSASSGRFISMADLSTASIQVNPDKEDSPFWDGQGGLLETAGPGQLTADVIGIARPWGVDEQITKRHAALPADWVFGQIDAYSGETHRGISYDGQTALFSMVSASKDKQDLFVLHGIVTHQPSSPTPTPDGGTPAATSTPASTPLVHAYAARGTAGSRLTLEYKVEDASGKSRDTIQITRKGRTVRTIQTRMTRNPKNGRKSVSWQTKGKRAGRYRFCVTAVNPLDAASAPACAGIRLR